MSSPSRRTRRKRLVLHGCGVCVDGGGGATTGCTVVGSEVACRWHAETLNYVWMGVWQFAQQQTALSTLVSTALPSDP